MVLRRSARGGRLPTEVEESYAMVGGKAQSPYPWGSTAPGANTNLAVYGCYYAGTGTCSGVDNIAPAGSVPAGNGAFGQSDLVGNLWEWAQDWDGCTFATPCDNCACLTPSTHRVIVGASYSSSMSLLTMVSAGALGLPVPSLHAKDIGVRCARTL